MYLESFNFIVRHIPGKSNPADPISRIDIREERTEEEWNKIADMEDDYESHPFLLTMANRNEWERAEVDEAVEEARPILFTKEVLDEMARGEDQMDLDEVVEEYAPVDLGIKDIALEQDKDTEIRLMKRHLSGDLAMTKDEV